MNQPLTVCPQPTLGMRVCAHRPVRPARRCGLALASAALLMGGIASPHPAWAVDGCQVLLCFAAPKWRSIPQCVPPIQQVLRDLARGRPFPSCSMARSGNTAQHSWASAPTFCPPQYTRLVDGEGAPTYTCDYSGAVSVSINGAPFARTWWAFGGETVTEFSPAAKAQFGTWDTRFEDDFARWLAAQPPTTPPAESGY